MTATELTSRFGKLTDLGIDKKGWGAQCLIHDVTTQWPTRDVARTMSKDTRQFCEECQNSQDFESLSVERFESTTQEQDESLAISEELQAAYDIEMAQPETRTALSYLQDTFDTDQPDEVTLSQIKELDDSIRSAAERWWSEQHAEDSVPVAEQPILGTFSTNNLGIHNAVAFSGYYFKTVCGKNLLKGESASQSDPDMCQDCLNGVRAAEEPKAKRGRGRPRVLKERTELAAIPRKRVVLSRPGEHPQAVPVTVRAAVPARSISTAGKCATCGRDIGEFEARVYIGGGLKIHTICL